MKPRHLILLLLLGGSQGFAETLVPQTQIKHVKKTARKLASNKDIPILIGLKFGFDGIWGKTSDSDLLAKGLGYSIGVSAQYYLPPRYRISLNPNFQYQQLGRSLLASNSGPLTDPSPANFDQSVKYLAVSLLFGFELEGEDHLVRNPMEMIGPRWWLEGGAEYLQPLSGSQTVAGDSSAFTPKKNTNAILGITGDFTFPGGFTLISGLHGIYSVAGSDGHVYGLRLSAGLYL